MIDGVRHYYDDNGNLYRKDKDLLPCNEYVINGYTYKTDEKARIVSAEGQLYMKDRDHRLTIKDSMDDIGKGDQQEGDDRGHLIGDQFNGSNGLENLIPQDSDINRVGFRKFENSLAEQVKAGRTVYVSIEPVYGGGSRRPSAIAIKYSIDGKKYRRIFPNGKG